MIHIVQQGEHLSSIAARYHFLDCHSIWDHTENAALTLLRGNPNVLFPGDRLYIPDKQSKELQAVTGRVHVFRIKRPNLLLRIELFKLYLNPVSKTRCELTVETNVIQTESDAQGTIEQEIPATAQRAKLDVQDRIRLKAGEVRLDFSIPIYIGHLDPAKERSGQEARLSNLGYYRLAVGSADDLEFVSAVEEFQCEHGLKIDGKCGPLTQARLLEVHGC